MELIAVVVIMSVLIAASVPIFKSLGDASQVLSRGAHELAALVEYARAEAIARQTYVWVGFRSDADRGEVVAGAVYSLDGTGANTDPTNLQPLSRVIRISNTEIVERDQMSQLVQDLFRHDSVSVLQNEEGMTFSVGPEDFSDSTMTFTPGGEVLLTRSPGPMDGYVPGIDIGLRETIDGITPPDPQEAALFVDGALGAVQILRVQ